VRTAWPTVLALDRIWKAVLLNQFHDILPGSSISWVHRDAERTYAALAVELDEIIDTAQAALTGWQSAGHLQRRRRTARARRAGLGLAPRPPPRAATRSR